MSVSELGLAMAPFVPATVFTYLFGLTTMRFLKLWPALVAVALFFGPADGFSQSQLVRFDSIFGKFDVELTDNTPLTNANFLTYVDAGDYENTFIHRSVSGFIVQGGGFNFVNDTFGFTNQRDPVMNEPFNPNVRGTIAMAKLGGDPDSATNQWFISLEDNRANLDNQNGGFTAFGSVQADGMDLVDELAAVPVLNGSSIASAFTDLPLFDFANDGSNDFANSLLIFRQIVRVNNALGDLDGSGAIAGPDIDLLYAAFGATPANDFELDLNSDGQVDESDRDRVIERIAGTRLGDLDFNGTVNVLGDALALVINLGTTSGATYVQGDINGDGAVNVLGDALVLVTNLGFTAP